jgi:hypothetical protein
MDVLISQVNASQGRPLSATITSTLGFWLIAAFYFLPTLIADHRHKHNVVPIFLVNFLFGWLFLIGWIVALIWRCPTTPGRAAHDCDCQSGTWGTSSRCHDSCGSRGPGTRHGRIAASNAEQPEAPRHEAPSRGFGLAE